MKLLATMLASASLAAAATMAAPAAAQVQGNIATVNAPAAIISSTPFSTAFQQIDTTYRTQLDTIQARNTEREGLLRQLDTNSDGQLDQAEQTAAQNSQQATRIQAIDQEVAQLSQQVEGARIYAIQQIMAQYRAAVQQVVQQNQIQMVLSPESVVYAPPQANVTQQVSTALGALVPSVQITPPQGWQPSRNAVAMYQQVQQTLITLQAMQAQQNQQAQSAQQPNGR